MDGSYASRPGCIEGVNFADAEYVCEQEDMRLCTKQEVLSDIGMRKRRGCRFSKQHVWTGTSCTGLCCW